MATLDSFLTQIPDEFAKLEATIARVFETGRDSQLTQARVQGWIDEMNADAGVGDREGLTGSELEDQIRDDIARVIITKQVIMDFYGVSADEAEQVILGGNEGGINFSDLGAITGGGISSGGLRGVRDGGDLVKVERADGTSYFALRYNVQGIEHLYSFDSSAAAEKAIGGLEGATVLSEDTVNDGDTWLLGDAAAMVGQEGSYQVYFDGIMTEAALEAGIQNPGMLGLFAADQDIMRIMAEAEAGDWGDVRIEAAVRTTEFYLETLYPGIDNILKQGIGNPEAAWKNFNNSVEDMLTALGYTRDADGSFRSKIEEMLDLGITDEKFNESGSVFIRAEQSPQFRGILNQWVQDATGKNVTFDEWFDVLAGTTSTELAGIVEKATIQFQAEQSNLVLDPSDVARIASLTEFSEQAVGASFSTVEQQLLALGDVGLARYDLNVRALVDASLDIGPQAAQTRILANKTIRELGLADDPKDVFFLGFNQRGAPQRVGLLAAAPEAG